MLNRMMIVACVLVSLAAVVVLVDRTTPQAMAHCQVPCGIYDDASRLERMMEDATTIEKAVAQMGALAGRDDAQGRQQFARWVTTKEDHASNIISVTGEYFLTQKIKPVAKGAEGYDAYLKRLADHHAVMVAAMKCKQNAGAAEVASLKEAIGVIGHYWGVEHRHTIDMR